MSENGACGVNFCRRILCQSCILLVPSLRTRLLLLGSTFYTLYGPRHLKSRNGIFLACVSAFGLRM